jgi:formylglycine-generating enzyme required for sulfatase activity
MAGLLLVAAVGTAPGCVAQAGAPAVPAPARSLEQFTETIGGTAVSFVMKPVPGRRTGAEDGIEPFWIGETEVTWNAYDVFLFGLDEPDPAAESGADALARPSKPYISMDGASAFCAWLSARTGRAYRLPTEHEWRHACRLGAVDAARLGPHAWYRDNADFKTHPVATSAPDALGLYDMSGNASEWCTGADGRPVTVGGSYRDPAGAVGCAARAEPTDAWNASDPQFPKSVWWLADAGFVGFRVVCAPPQNPGAEP